MPDEIVIEFDIRTQSLDALHAAAYRLIGVATCKIDANEASFICHLSPRPTSRSAITDSASLKESFLDVVADENLRERVSVKTEPIRNLILSLAFGSLAAEPKDKV
jgi:His-Xaa-Ser system protein HxsD